MRGLIAVGLVLAGGATMRSATDPAVSDVGRQSLSAFLRDAVANGEVPGVMAMVVGRDRILYEGAFGKRDVARNAAMTADSVFRIASMTKPLTTAAILMLADEGRLKVDDPVGTYLPRFKTSQVLLGVDEAHGTLKTRPATAVMTVRHLLTHTSGIGYSWSDPGLAAAQRVTKATNDSDLPLVHDPGTRWTYGASTRVLGDIVQAVTGQTIDAFLEARVTRPLGMVDTAFDVPAASHPRVVTVHQRTNGRLVELANPASLTVMPRGDGGLFSTAADYARFIQMVLITASRAESACFRRQPSRRWPPTRWAPCGCSSSPTRTARARARFRSAPVRTPGVSGCRLRPRPAPARACGPRAA